jgi:hypothetical protein
MFILRTGLQGNGKTLNTIKEVDLKAAKEGRTVYYHNITGFNPQAKVLQAEWVEFDDPFKWYELPLNAIIVIDEAQKFFRVRPQGAPVPEYASALETMRKQGHELHCITQNPKLIDVHFRNLCNGHIHYVRGHQGKVIKRWRFESPVNVDKDKNSLDRYGEATRITIDKRYFGVYQSIQGEAEHHFKFRAPRALFVFLGACVLLGAGGWYIYKARIAPDAVETAPTSEQQVVSAVQPAQALAAAVSPGDYVVAHTPRIPDVPSSAPIYDELTKPQTYPKPVCVSTKDEALLERMGTKLTIDIYKGRVHGCRCNTQQGTRLNVSFQACMNYVENGAFDPAKPDRLPTTPVASTQQYSAQAVGLPEGRGSTSAGVRSSFVVVADTSRDGKPLSP